jgi:hypothetical protein
VSIAPLLASGARKSPVVLVGSFSFPAPGVAAGIIGTSSVDLPGWKIVADGGSRG